MNENKVPCGGFRIGDGLTIEGDTLKSLGGEYIKVNTNDGVTFEFMDDSPLKTFEEIRQKIETSIVTLLAYNHNIAMRSFFFDTISDISIGFCSFFVDEENQLKVVILFIDSDNKITLSQSSYTLTPAT